MTWKEFKEKVEAQGVTDEMEVLAIDWNGKNDPDVGSTDDDDDRHSFDVE